MGKDLIKRILRDGVILLVAIGLVYSLFEKQRQKWEEEQYVEDGLREEKPVIYLYPEEVTDVEVRLEVDGELTCTYPAYEDGWKVTAHPDGTLVDGEGKSYTCLFWEAEGKNTFDLTRGFCVAGADTAAFLEEHLEAMGLNARERNEFIIYWLPRMEGNPYNLITFQQEAYTEQAKLEITPAPDSLLRVFMAWKPLETWINVEPQTFAPFEREGFTVIEWGGAELAE